MIKEDSEISETDQKVDSSVDADKKLVATAQERFKQSQDALFTNQNNFSDDVAFYNGDGQWDGDTLRQRELDDRPCMIVNRQKSFVRQVTNDALQNPIACKVRPVDDSADQETADIFTGLIRHIESNSNAEIAYSNAFFYSVVGGMGFYRITTDYISPQSFNQDIFIKPIHNSLSVFFDPDGRMPDGSDWKWCFIVDEIGRDEYDRRYPKADGANFEADQVDDNDWSNKDTVRIAEYFHLDHKKDVLYLLDDGTEMLKSDYDEIPDDLKKSTPSIADKRDTETAMVKWCMLGGNEILDRKEFPGRYIPVLPVFGDIIESNGKVDYSGLTRPGKDSQRMLNYYRSTEIELLALQPKAPFIAAEGQIEGYEEEWANANNVSYSVLPYKPSSIAGVPIPPPQRQSFAAPPSGVLQGAANSTQDMMDIYGIHEAGLGQKSNETSGAAIKARAMQGNNSTFNFIHNKQISIQHCARILVDIIPKIYDTKRVIRILGEDGSEEMKTVNAPVMEKDDNGNRLEKFYDLDAGTYDVTVSAGASYSTRRQEAADSMTMLLQTSPQLMQTHGDLIAKAMDWPGADKFAKRSEKMLPPELKDHKEEDGPQIPPEVQQQMQQAQEQMQQMDEAIQKMSSELEDKNMEAETNKAKIEIDQYNAKTTRMKAVCDMKTNLEDEMWEIDMEGNKVPSKTAESIDRMMQNQEFLSQQLSQLIQLASINAAPKEIIKDAEGRPIGIRPVINGDQY